MKDLEDFLLEDNHKDKYLKHEHGYFIFQQEWRFVPFEKYFSESTLEEILKNIRLLNSKKIFSHSSHSSH